MGDSLSLNFTVREIYVNFLGVYLLKYLITYGYTFMK